MIYIWSDNMCQTNWVFSYGNNCFFVKGKHKEFETIFTCIMLRCIFPLTKDTANPFRSYTILQTSSTEISIASTAVSWRKATAYSISKGSQIFIRLEGITKQPMLLVAKPTLKFTVIIIMCKFYLWQCIQLRGNFESYHIIRLHAMIESNKNTM